jgi:hypothetical protein
MAIVREFVAASVAQHVRMHGEFEPGVLTGSFNQLPHCVVRQWPAKLCHKEIRRVPGSRDAAASVPQQLALLAWVHVYRANKRAWGGDRHNGKRRPSVYIPMTAMRASNNENATRTTDRNGREERNRSRGNKCAR